MLSRLFCTTFSHFLSRLKVYGFKEIKGSSGLLEFGNKNFVRGQPELLTEMHTKAVIERCRQGDKMIKAHYEAKEANDRFKDLRI
ncbi:Heat shock factor protein HSF24 [Cardamine amara subsp. amara]|uniref:Heat shock factor protein HSF24 n=1 Tax=Cardamine amara subsp. amara TaxID=228776 RepID=A0ABD1BQ79_CARAN